MVRHTPQAEDGGIFGYFRNLVMPALKSGIRASFEEAMEVLETRLLIMHRRVMHATLTWLFAGIAVACAIAAAMFFALDQLHWSRAGVLIAAAVVVALAASISALTQRRIS